MNTEDKIAILKTIIDNKGLCGNISCSMCLLYSKCKVWCLQDESMVPKLLNEAKRIIVDNAVDEELSR